MKPINLSLLNHVAGERGALRLLIADLACKVYSKQCMASQSRKDYFCYMCDLTFYARPHQCLFFKTIFLKLTTSFLPPLPQPPATPPAALPPGLIQ